MPKSSPQPGASAKHLHDTTSAAQAYEPPSSLTYRSASSLSNYSVLPRSEHNIESMVPKGQRNETLTPPQTPPYRINGRSSMIDLMCQTKGRIQGYVNYKFSQATSWETGSCTLNNKGALFANTDTTKAATKTMISDCRGCKCLAYYDASCKSAVLKVISADGGQTVHLRPSSPGIFDNWIAAFLCWRNISAGQCIYSENQKSLPKQISLTVDQQIKRLSAVRNYYSDRSTSAPSASRAGTLVRESPCKVATVTTNCYAGERPAVGGNAEEVQRLLSPSQNLVWQDGHCKLQGDGSLKISSANMNHTCLAAFNLPKLSSRSIQCLHESVCKVPLTLAIYPKPPMLEYHGHVSEATYLHFSSRALFEEWLTILRCFSIPEIFGPGTKDPDSFTLEDSYPGDQDSRAETYRIRQTLEISVKRVEPVYRVGVTASEDTVESLNFSPDRPSREEQAARAYDVQILLDGFPRASRTMVESKSKDDSRGGVFSFYELPSLRPTIRILFNETSTHAAQQADKPSQGSAPYATLGDRIEGVQHAMHGSMASGELVLETIQFSDIEDIQHSVLIMDRGIQVGSALLSVSFVEQTVLPELQYESLSSFIGDLSNHVPMICNQRQPQYAEAFGEIFSNIFQASGNAVEWLLYLIREQVISGEKGDVSSEQDLCLGDHTPSLPSRKNTGLDWSNVTNASSLFRTMPMLSTSITSYLERLGKIILQQTLSDTIERLIDEDHDCEVNPSETSVPEGGNIQQNWRRLLDITSNIWACIYFSASRFPTELKIVLRALRDCVEVTCEHLKPTISYTCVSIFVIDRFFCAGLNNPVKFGLVRRIPSRRVYRTLQLVARSLITLASMTTFGPKEPWMSPMNRFNTSHRQQFKEFTDRLCDLTEVDDDLQSRGFDIKESFQPKLFLSTMTSDIYHYLPSSCREDLLNLPHMADLPANLAALVSLCLNVSTSRKLSTHTSTHNSFNELGMGEDIKGESFSVFEKYQQMCNDLQIRTSTTRMHSKAQEVIDQTVVRSWISVARRYDSNLDEFWDLGTFPQTSVKDFGNLSKSLTTDPATTRADTPLAEPVITARPSSASNSSRHSWIDSQSLTTKSSGKESKKKSGSKAKPEDNALRKLGWA